MSVRLATGPDSWGVWFANDPKQVPWRRFLDEVVTAGYRAIELGPWGYLPTEASVLSKELDSRGLELCGATVIANLEDPGAWPELEGALTQVGQFCTTFAIEQLVLIDEPYNDLLTGASVAASSLTPDEFSQLIAIAKRATALVRDAFGVQVTLHPHAETHLEYANDVRAIMDATSADELSLCLDTGHIAYTGGDPVELFRTYHNRITHLHLKDVDDAVQRSLSDAPDPFVDAVGRGIFVHPSDGVVDFEELARLVDELDFSAWGVVEHDMYPTNPEVPLPIATSTREYFESLGFVS